MKLVDSNLELQTWKAPQSGLGIGDAVPTSFGYRYPTAGLEFFIENIVVTKNTPSWLGAISRTLPTGYSNLKLNFEVMWDGWMPAFARSLEFDIRLAFQGYGYNCSGQLNRATGSWQVSDKNGNWIDSGYIFKPLDPWLWHRFSISYHFDFLIRSYGPVAIKIDNESFVIPLALQNLPATTLAWADSCNVQVQQDIYGNVVGGFSQVMRNINLEWTV
jgi:hypothetical protein